MAKGKSGVKGGIAALDQSPSHLLHRALQRALDIYVEEFGEAGITQRQFAVMAAADEREGATQADLVRITGIDRSTLADMATRMIAKGLLERERSNVDARANAVRLTDGGREALAEARPKMAAADARLMKLISGGGRRAAFVGLLARPRRVGGGQGARHEGWGHESQARQDQARQAQDTQTAETAEAAETPEGGQAPQGRQEGEEEDGLGPIDIHLWRSIFRFPSPLRGGVRGGGASCEIGAPAPEARS